MAFIFIENVPTGFRVYESAEEVRNLLGWNENHTADKVTLRTTEGNRMTIRHPHDVVVVLEDA